MSMRWNKFILWPLRAIDVLHIYLWLIMLGLFLQGSGSLALRLIPGLPSVTPALVVGLMLAHIPHAILHIGGYAEFFDRHPEFSIINIRNFDCILKIVWNSLL